MDFMNDDPDLIEERFLNQTVTVVTAISDFNLALQKVILDFFDLACEETQSRRRGECQSTPYEAVCELEAVLESE